MHIEKDVGIVQLKNYDKDRFRKEDIWLNDNIVIFFLR